MPISSSSKAEAAAANSSSLNVRAPAPGKPRFQRKKAVNPTKKFESSIKLELVTDADFCHQLLVDGFVQSYVDFYHLTHRADPNQGEGGTAKIKTSFEDMVILRDNLMGAENCRRSGNTSGVYTAYNNLADVYAKKGDWKTSIFFHEKCLEVAQLTSDKKAELDAINALGTVYQKMGDFSSACTLHERQEDLATMQDDTAEVGRANSELFKVYQYYGRVAETNAHSEEALAMFRKALSAAQKCDDARGTAAANGAIGNIFMNDGNFQEGLPYLQEWVRISTDLGDSEGRCQSHSALALAYDSLGRSEKALGELAMVHGISLQTGDAPLQSQAARSLGMLYSKVGELSKSVASMEQHFDLLKIIAVKKAESRDSAAGLGNSMSVDSDMSSVGVKGDSPMTQVDLARAFVGVSKGNMLFPSYSVAVKKDAGLLLDWKLNRSALDKDSTEPSAVEEQAQSSAEGGVVVEGATDADADASNGTAGTSGGGETPAAVDAEAEAVPEPQG